jgi:hypothetical protein
MRSRYAKPNGVIGGWYLDTPIMEVKDGNSKKNYIRAREKHELQRDRETGTDAVAG